MLKMQAKPIGEDELGVLSKVKALNTLRGRYPPEYDLFDCIFEVIQRKLNHKLWVAPRLNSSLDNYFCSGIFCV